MSNEKIDNCEICGKNLKYALNPEEYQNLKCEFCDLLYTTNTFCEDGHYICDKCHSIGPIQVIEDICEKTSIRDPFLLVNKIMKHPKFKMYGPEHHVLSAAVIITTLRNNSIKKPNGNQITLLDIKEAIRRAS